MQGEKGQHETDGGSRRLEPAAVIDLRAFERDREDSAWREFVRASEKHLDALERKGRSR
jgi:hypothetical protein